VTQERELEIEKRLSTLETQMENLTKLVTDNNAFWRNFLGSTTGGVIVALAAWWITRP
jgi:hypothetical protein